MPGQDLSIYGKALLSAVGGKPGMVTPGRSAAAVKRWNLDSPDNLLQVMPEALQIKILNLPESIATMRPESIEQTHPISRQDRRMRIRFWEEYEIAHRERRLMDMGYVIAGTGVLSWEDYLATKLGPSHLLLSWFSSPPPEYRLEMQESHQIGLGRLNEIMSLPIVDPASGKINVGVGLLVLQAFKMADQRIHGAVAQKNINVNLGDGTGESGASKQLDMGSVEKRIAEIEAALRGETPLSPPPEKPPEEEVKSEIIPPALSVQTIPVEDLD